MWFESKLESVLLKLEDLNRYLRIGYDLDDVLADLDGILRQKLSVNVGKYVAKHDRTSFYFEDIPTLLDKLQITKEQLGPLVVDCFKYIDIGKLPAVESAIRVIKELIKDGHKVFIITARSKKSEEVTKLWLSKLGLSNVMVYFAGSGPIRTAPKNSKAKVARLLKLDYFIDDSTENIGQFFKTGQNKLTVPIAYDQPWNSSYKGPRIKHHSDTLDLLNKLENK